MKAGDVVLIQAPQVAGGPSKSRPALVLALLPGTYQNVLICGISTQLHGLQPDWDDRIEPSDADFVRSGLRRTSAIRPELPLCRRSSEILGVIGRVDVASAKPSAKMPCRIACSNNPMIWGWNGSRNGLIPFSVQSIILALVSAGRPRKEQHACK